MKSFELNSRLHIEQITDAEILNCDIAGRISDNFVMFYLISGKVNIAITNEVLEVDGGSAAIIAPNEFHCIKKSDGSKYAYIEFTSDGVPLETVLVALTDQEKELMSEACNIIECDPDTFSLQRLYAILELVAVGCITKEKLLSVNVEKDATLFSKAANIMQQNITEQLSVSTLADRLNISLSHLKRIFAKYTLIGVHEYFTYLKITRAKELLKLGETVTRTAKLSGFSNQAYFSAAFKRITGISPKEFAGDIKTHRIQKEKPEQTKKSQTDLPNYLL